MPFSWLVASLFALGAAVDAARTLKKPNILLFFPDEWRYDWGGRCPHCCLLINILTVFSIPIDIIVNILYFKIVNVHAHMTTRLQARTTIRITTARRSLSARRTLIGCT